MIELAFSVVAESVEEAALDLRRSDRQRVGCVIGTSKGGIRSLAASLRDRACAVGPAGVPHESCWSNWPAARVASHWNLAGPCLCPVAACATGLMCVVRGLELIRDGYCEAVIVGSSDASLEGTVLASFRRMGVLARGFDGPATACRPYDRRRNGFLVGEGAAALVLERRSHALLRGARAYGELLAARCLSDPTGLTQLDDRAAALCRLIQLVLGQAERTSDELDYVNLHGTATRQNDLCETRALKAALGTAAERVSCSGLKGGLGHLLGAAGSVETAATLLAMRDSLVPPTVNLDEPDDQCDLDYTPVRPRRRCVQHALKVSLGFGGHLVAALFGPAEPSASR